MQLIEWRRQLLKWKMTYQFPDDFCVHYVVAQCPSNEVQDIVTAANANIPFKDLMSLLCGTFGGKHHHRAKFVLAREIEYAEECNVPESKRITPLDDIIEQRSEDIAKTESALQESQSKSEDEIRLKRLSKSNWLINKNSGTVFKYGDCETMNGKGISSKILYNRNCISKNIAYITDKNKEKHKDKELHALDKQNIEDINTNNCVLPIVVIDIIMQNMEQYKLEN
ncbi:hypothetical protein RFI_26800 [Reticulomyxa filosa]|uniref:Uncharacterized protein n=1 Tax=Reticulomyxa filosa TaxID=46433 RepID=X6MA79_RETFI|nr:hypothetical protein RFI_26800 [Reticulomyxa filosa]|eukprot:ETO10576.1 hypothetical protein RFI_26800 [Reticulomyxa filosa]